MQFVDILIVCLAVVLVVMYVTPRVMKLYIKRKVKFISASELKEKLSDKEDVAILDIRDTKSFNGFMGHIEDSVNVPLFELVDKVKNQDANFEGLKDVPIVIVEQTNSLKGLKAFQMLVGSGFDKVTLLDGGLIMWIKAKNPTTKFKG